MARGRKEGAALILEERLHAALVPGPEQPYRVPENWCWTRVGEISQVVTGNTPSRKIPQYYGGDFPFFKPGDLDAGRHVYDAAEYLTEEGKAVSRTIPAQATMVCCIGSIGKCGFSEVAGATNQQINSIVPQIDPLYFYYYCNTEEFVDQLRSKASATTISIVNKSKIERCYTPIPPLSEQFRIAARIENLFGKLEAVRKTLQAVLDSCETRRAAILHKAFTGELTAQWRKEHGIALESWTQKALSHVASLQTGLMKGKHYSSETVILPYLRVANVQDGFLNLDEIKEIEVDKRQIERYMLSYGDVLFTEGGDFDKLGRGTVWEGQIQNCLHQNHIFVIRPDKNILNPYFLSYQAGSGYGKNYFLSCSKQTTNLASINSAQLKNFPVLIPPMAEQQEIVSIISSLIAKEQKVKEIAKLVLAQIDLVKKSILSRAFRGELGTNDPAEASSVELLKQILSKTE